MHGVALVVRLNPGFGDGLLVGRGGSDTSPLPSDLAPTTCQWLSIRFMPSLDLCLNCLNTSKVAKKVSTHRLLSDGR